jgi:flagellar protein FlaG
VSTETVPALLASATKRSSSDTPVQKRANAQPASHPAPRAPAPAPVANRSIQETMEKVAAQLESYLRSVGRSLQFSIDSESGRTVISVRDSSTGDLIRQIPNAEAMRLAQSLGSQTNTLIDLLV